MKKNMRLMLTLSASLALLAVTVVAFAQSERPQGTQPKIVRRIIARLEAKLNITPEQRAQVKDILKTEEPTIVALAAQAKLERNAIAALPYYNDAAVRDIAQKYEVTNMNIVVERAKLRLELRGVLTAQQLEQLEKLESAMDSRFEERLSMVIDQI